VNKIDFKSKKLQDRRTLEKGTKITKFAQEGIPKALLCMRQHLLLPYVPMCHAREHDHGVLDAWFLSCF